MLINASDPRPRNGLPHPLVLLFGGARGEDESRGKVDPSSTVVDRVLETEVEHAPRDVEHQEQHESQRYATRNAVNAECEHPEDADAEQDRAEHIES